MSYRTTRAFATEGASAAALASRLEQKTYELAISEWNNGAERRGARAAAEAMREAAAMTAVPTAYTPQQFVEVRRRIADAIRALPLPDATPDPRDAALAVPSTTLVISRLLFALTTHSNDDYSKPGTRERERHVERDAIMREAWALIEGMAGQLTAKSATIARLSADLEAAREVLAAAADELESYAASYGRDSDSLPDVRAALAKFSATKGA